MENGSEKTPKIKNQKIRNYSNNKQLFSDINNDSNIQKSQTRIHGHPMICIKFENENLNQVYVISMLTLLDIIVWGLVLHNRPVHINYSSSAIMHTVAILSGYYLICEAFLKKNIYQLSLFLVFSILFIANLFLDTCDLFNIYGLFKAMNFIIRVIELIYMISQVKNFYKKYSFYYYKKIGGNSDLQCKFF